MKQVFYGPTGYGKSHLILHGLLSKQNLIIITTNTSVQREFEYVGLSDVVVKTIPISVGDISKSDLPNINIDIEEACELQRNNILGFNVGKVPNIHEEAVIDKIMEWIETTGVSNSSHYTIVFINIYKEINNPSFVKRIENWNTDIVIEHTADKFSIEQGRELESIRKSGQWFEIPIFVKMKEQPKK